MDAYTFIVEDFIIHETRSVHNDTLQYNCFILGEKGSEPRPPRSVNTTFL